MRKSIIALVGFAVFGIAIPFTSAQAHSVPVQDVAVVQDELIDYSPAHVSDYCQQRIAKSWVSTKCQK